MKKLKMNTNTNTASSKATSVLLRDTGKALKVRTHVKAAKASPKLF